MIIRDAPRQPHPDFLRLVVVQGTFFVVAVPTLVRALALTPRLLRFTPTLPPILADGLVTRIPLDVTRNFGLRTEMSFLAM